MFVDLSEVMVERSALAAVNGHVWDMKKPLEDDCVVELLHFHLSDPFNVNKAFWRTCSFMLGAALDSIFKDDRFIELHSFPAPNGKRSVYFTTSALQDTVDHSS